MKTYHILNLGAGWQSTTAALLSHDGELELESGEGVTYDYAIFADTGEEDPGGPDHISTLDHVEWLSKECHFPVITVSIGARLGDSLIDGVNGQWDRLAAIPAHVRNLDGEMGITRRQCTREFKIAPVEKWIRRELLQLEPRQRIPNDVRIIQHIGNSVDEAGRAARVRKRFDGRKNWDVLFPLIDMRMRTGDCAAYLARRVPHKVPRSACTFCPFKSNRQWRYLRDTSPDGWERAVEVDRNLRREGAFCGRGMEGALYIHRSGVPLEDANLHDDQGELFSLECEGGCGF